MRNMKGKKKKEYKTNGNSSLNILYFFLYTINNINTCTFFSKFP